MMLSKSSVDTITDLLENRLSMMGIGDQDDLREKIILQRALAELRGADSAEAGVLNTFSDIPRRGRRRKVHTMTDAEQEHYAGHV